MRLLRPGCKHGTIKGVTVKRTSLLQLPDSLRVGGLAAAGKGRPEGGPTRLVMGVDGGATKTLAAVLDVERRTVHLGHGGPSNQDAVGVHAAGQALLRAAKEAADGAGVEVERIESAVLAVAGTNTEAISRHVHQSAPQSWIVVNDVVGAWATATCAQPGVGAISGTGSNVFGVGRDGRSWRAGGWGHVLGDEGSGYWLGVRSIASALHDRDGSGPQTALTEAALRFFEASDVETLVALVYAEQPLSKSEIASFAIETARLAGEGDAVAAKLYRRGARELAAQILAVVRETGLDGRFPVGLIGSAFKAGDVFVQPLSEAVRQGAPGAEVEVVDAAPVSGALMLALNACDASEAIAPVDLDNLVNEALRASVT